MLYIWFDVNMFHSEKSIHVEGYVEKIFVFLAPLSCINTEEIPPSNISPIQTQMGVLFELRKDTFHDKCIYLIEFPRSCIIKLD